MYLESLFWCSKLGPRPQIVWNPYMLFIEIKVKVLEQRAIPLNSNSRPITSWELVHYIVMTMQKLMSLGYMVWCHNAIIINHLTLKFICCCHKCETLSRLVLCLKLNKISNYYSSLNYKENNIKWRFLHWILMLQDWKKITIVMEVLIDVHYN